MASCLLHTQENSVSLTATVVRRLLQKGDGDAALLYLALLERGGQVLPRALAGELRWDKGRIETAEQVLQEIGLLAPTQPQKEPVLEPAQERPQYQSQEVQERLEQPGEFPQLVSAVEQLLGKRLSTVDVGALLGLYDYLALPADVIYLLVSHCLERVNRRYGAGRRPGMKQIEKEGYHWAKIGIDTQAEAAQYLADYARRQALEPQFMQVLNLGDRKAAPSEEKYLHAWQEMGFTPDVVSVAYDKTVMRCHELKWPYLNAILKKWHQDGLHTLEEIAGKDTKPVPKPPITTAPSDEMRKYVQQLHNRKEEDAHGI